VPILFRVTVFKILLKYARNSYNNTVIFFGSNRWNFPAALSGLMPLSIMIRCFADQGKIYAFCLN